MDKKTFLALLRDALQCEGPLEMDLPLAQVPEWDSLSAMATLALAERSFGRRLKLARIKKAATVDDLYALLTAN
jgi:acyl carrier protein